MGAAAAGVSGGLGLGRGQKAGGGVMGDAVTKIALAVTAVGATFAMAQCSIADSADRTERFRLCLQAGGNEDAWTGSCVLPTRGK